MGAFSADESSQGAPYGPIACVSPRSDVGDRGSCLTSAMHMFSLGEVFTLFFLTLGPIKLLGPFAQQTRGMDARALQSIVLRVFLIALTAVIVGTYAGSLLALRWHISLPAILITTGIILFMVAIRIVMSAYEPPSAAPAPLPAAPMAAILRLTFPLVVTPYGIAAAIALLAATTDGGRERAIYLLLVAVMVLNLLAMLFIRQIMRGPMLLILQIVGSVLGVLQVGLAIQILILALRVLHLIPA